MSSEFSLKSPAPAARIQ